MNEVGVWAWFFQNQKNINKTEDARTDLADAAHRAGYELARAQAAKLGAHIVAYDVAMKGRMADIAARIAAHHGLRDIKERSKRPEVSHPRQEAYAAMLDAGFTSYRIGAWFGRDHSTIVEGAQAHRKRTKP